MAPQMAGSVCNWAMTEQGDHQRRGHRRRHRIKPERQGGEPGPEAAEPVDETARQGPGQDQQLNRSHGPS